MTPQLQNPQAIWNGHASHWAEAEVIAEPVRKAERPTVLVKRKTGGLIGPDGQELVYMPGYPVISLFTGAGGMDIGLERAGFCTLVQHEWMEAACQTLIANRPQYFRHSALIQGDIRQTPTSMLLSEAGLRVGEAYIVAGGPPCQGFSTANKNAIQNKADKRNDLVFEYLRVVRQAQPRFFIMENVSGFVRFNDHEYFKAFLSAAHDCYYELVYGLLDAVEYGVPQYRCRFVCMGTRRDLVEIDGMLASMPEPQNFGEKTLKMIQMPEHASLFAELDSDHRRRLIRPPGIRYFPDREVLIPPEPVDRDGERAKAFIEFYDRIERHEPDRLVFAPAAGGGR